MDLFRRFFSLILALVLFMGPVEGIMFAEEIPGSEPSEMDEGLLLEDPVPPSMEMEDPIPPEEEPEVDPILPEEKSETDPVPSSEETEESAHSGEPEFLPAVFSAAEAPKIYPGSEETFGTSGEATLQSYMAEDGTWHNIYWARGLTPPSMTGADSFHSFTIARDSGYTFYQAPFSSNGGYYDLNKTETNGYCYLGAASNLIYWWIDQNSDYIQQYLQAFETGNGRFTQHSSLHPIPGTSQWQSLTVRPKADQNHSAYLSQKLLDAPLVKEVFANNYLQPDRKDLGFRADMVLDFFLNGYDPLPPKDVNTDNNPGNYDPNPDGGYFFPVFGREKLTTYQGGGGYDHYKDRLRQYFQQGMGIAFSVRSLSNTHAITIWGAEYDSEDNLVRLYATDTDDFDSNILAQNQTYAQALNSYDVVKTSDGDLHLDNRDDKSVPGGFVLNACYTVDLNRIGWEKAFSDPAPQPEPPEITGTPRSRKYNPGDQPEAIRVYAELNAQDQGSWFYLMPQWYESEDSSGTGARAIPGAVSWSYTPDLSLGIGTRYYFCRVTAVKYGNTSYQDSPVAVIQVTENPVTNAGKPILGRFGGNIKDVNQYGNLTLSVKAKSPDGGTLSYQWLRRDTAYASMEFLPISGATESTLQVPTDVQGEFMFKCRVTNTNNGPEINGSTAASEVTPAFEKVIVGPPKKTQAQLTITGIPENPAYGDVFIPSYAGGSGSGDVTWSVTGAAALQTDGSVKITDVGTFTVTAQKAEDSEYREATATRTGTAKKAKPQVGEVVDPGNLTTGTNLKTLVLSHSGKTPGKVKLAEGVHLQPGTRNYSWIFIPEDAVHYEKAQGLVELTVSQGEKETVKLEATAVSQNYNGNPQVGYQDLKLIPQWNGSLEIMYRTKQGTALKVPPSDVGDYLVTLKIPDSDSLYKGSLTLSFSIFPQLLKTVKAEMKAPAVGEKPITEIPGSGFQGKILWNPQNSVFLAGVTYTAQITLQPDHNHCFNSQSTFNGETGTYDSQMGTLSLQKSYTLPKKNQSQLTITGIPENPAYGDAFTPSCTGGSGSGAVTWSVTGAAALQTDGSVKITDVGTFTVTAQKAEDREYSKTTATRTGTAKKAKPQVGEVTDPGNLTTGIDPETLVLSHSGKTPGKVTLAEGVHLQLGTRNYSWVFIPEDGDHYEKAQGLVELTVSRGEKETVKIEATAVSPNYNGNPQAGYRDLKLSPQWNGSLEIMYRTQQGTALKVPPRDVGDYQVTLKIPDSDPQYQGSLTLSFSINPKLLQTAMGEIKEPIVGEKPITEIPGSGFQGKILWNPQNSVFLAGVTYTAQITLQPDHNHCFNSQSTFNGETGTYDSQMGTLSLQKSYSLPMKGHLEIPKNLISNLREGDQLWLDGNPVAVVLRDGKFYIPAEKSQKTRVLQRFSFYEGTAGDPHTSYPTSMEVWLLSSDGSLTPLPELTDLMIYSGMSIRFTGRRGIRMITGMECSVRENLIEKGTDGWFLQEYGTAVAWTEELPRGAEPVLGTAGTRQNHAYRRGEKDAVFGYSGSKLQYTNVLVGFQLEECAKDISLRPYVILKSKAGETITVYGGTLNRSIGYVAYQNRNVFPKGSPAYKFVWEMIRAAYGDLFDSQYQG